MRILPQTTSPSGRSRLRRTQFATSVAIALIVFVLVVPKIASYRSVWGSVSRLTWVEMFALIAASAWSLLTCWFQLMAAMPGLRLSQAALSNQSSTTVANVLPAGGAVAIGVTYAMSRSWGFSGSEIALMVSTTGIWNSFLKLLLPVLALALLAISGRATSSLLAPALIGLVILAGCCALFVGALRSAAVARAIGDRAGAMYSTLRRAVRRPPVTAFGNTVVRFRGQTLALLSERWLALTFTTVASHLGLFVVLLLALRSVGVHADVVSAMQVLAVFAFARLLSAAPITPGGVGVVELALIGGLYAAGRHSTHVPLGVFSAQVTAAALLFRALTFGIQIPIGACTWAIWLRTRTRPDPRALVMPLPSAPSKDGLEHAHGRARVM